jgi:hypothetical protein
LLPDYFANLCCLRVSFTQLEKDQYYGLVHILRPLPTQEQPFWMLEENWPITND